MNQIHAQPLGAVIEKLYKQPAPVLNKPGATAAAGTAYVANQPADGYNVFVTTPNLYLALEKDKLFGIQSPYRLEQITPIALLSADPLALCVQTENPIKSVKELVAAAKAKQGTMAFSSSGSYGIQHVPMAMFLDAAGIKMRHVPTTGGGPAIIQLLGGHVDTHPGGLAAVYPHIKSGKLRALGLTDVKRSAALPDVPTLKETGYDVEAYLWVGLFTASGIPEPTLVKLREVIRKSVADPMFQDSMTKGKSWSTTGMRPSSRHFSRRTTSAWPRRSKRSAASTMPRSNGQEFAGFSTGRLQCENVFSTIAVIFIHECNQ